MNSNGFWHLLLGDNKRKNEEFVKYKCKLLNQEQNKKYRELQTKADKTDDEINNLDDFKAELKKMSHVVYNVCLEAGVETSKAPVNVHNLANLH